MGVAQPSRAKPLWLPALGLSTALLIAFLSSVARSGGQWRAARFLALVAIILALVAAMSLLPRLLSRLKLDLLNYVRFFRFTRRGTLFLSIVVLVGFAAINTGNNLVILVFSALLAAVLVSGSVSNLVLYGIQVSLSLPETLHAGQNAVFFVTAQNLKKVFPSFALCLKSVRGQEEELGDETSFYVQEADFPYIKAGERVKLSLSCKFERRGIYSVEGFEVTTTFPFGFFTRGRRIQADGNIVIYPRLVDLGPLFRLYPHLQGGQETTRKGIGSGLYNIRPYAGGDSTRFIEWKSTARLGQLMVKDFVSEEDSSIHIAFSTYLPRQDTDHFKQFEKAVSHVASLAHLWQQKAQAFTFSSGEFEIEVTQDWKSYESLMEYLACVSPSSHRILGGIRSNERTVLFAAGGDAFVGGRSGIDILKL